MRSLFGLLVGCGIATLTACSPTEPPGSVVPPTVTTPPVQADVQTPNEEPPADTVRDEPIMEGDTGLAVGQEAPAFLLADQTGTRRSLDEFLKEGKVALVFYRSADWWPPCRKQLVQLQDDLPRITATGTQVIGISYDSVEILKKFSDSAGITFPLLSDQGSLIIRAYGIYHRDGIPHPGIFLLDEKGTVREKLFVEGYKDRPENAELIEAAKRVK